MPKEEIKNDIERAKEALASAERNFLEGDIFTAANRTFVACENSVYVMLKLKFGSASVNRKKILTNLNDISTETKEYYDTSYDLRVQADYGRSAQKIILNKENLKFILDKVKLLVQKAEELIKKQ